MAGGQNDFYGNDDKGTSSILGSDLSAISFFWVKCVSDLCAPCFWMYLKILVSKIFMNIHEYSE